MMLLLVQVRHLKTKSPLKNIYKNVFLLEYKVYDALLVQVRHLKTKSPLKISTKTFS